MRAYISFFTKLKKKSHKDTKERFNFFLQHRPIQFAYLLLIYKRGSSQMLKF